MNTKVETAALDAPCEVSRPVVVNRLSQTAPFLFEESATPQECDALAKLFDARSVDKFLFRGRIEASGADGWRLVGRVQATVTQSCVVTLAPVPARISEPMDRRFVPRDAAEISLDFDIDAEDDGDDDLNILGDIIDPGAVAIEIVSLALEPYPRAQNADFEGMDPRDPGEDAPVGTHKPFAGLDALRRKLAGED